MPGVAMNYNQGVQDPLLFAADRSMFTNVGYRCTSNFAVEYRDIDPCGTAAFGTTLQFVLPKAADLLGPTDLIVELKAPNGGGVSASGRTPVTTSWVDSLGHAMIETITLEIGSNVIETITGEQLQIQNELMRDENSRLSHAILRTKLVGNSSSDSTVSTNKYSRALSSSAYASNAATTKYGSAKRLIIPLNLFFSKHPSQYFPLAAIAGSNDVRVSIRLRPIAHLIQYKCAAEGNTSSISFPDNNAIDKAYVRCHYVHVTGPEAASIMAKQHVRLMKMWGNFNFTKSIATGSGTWSINNLVFLHPVSQIIFIVRLKEEIESTDIVGKDSVGTWKGQFNFLGGDTNRNPDDTRNSKPNFTVDSFRLHLNGQDLHPSLASKGIDRQYMEQRLQPLMYTEARSHVTNHNALNSSSTYPAALTERPNVFTYSFAMNPEGLNPSGSVNFSKVSHAKMEIDYTVTNASSAVDFQVDIYPVYYNWLQIQDGRGLLSFA